MKVGFNAPNTDERRCERCNKSMLMKYWESTGRNGGLVQIREDQSITGISLTMTKPDSPYLCETEELKRQAGKYELDKSYDFCMECWIDSLMGEPKWPTIIQMN